MKYVFLERSWEKDRVIIENRMSEYVADKDPFCLVMYPEGTFLDEEHHVRSQRFQETHGLRVTTNVLAPRTTGLHFCRNKLDGTITAIYNVTLAFPEVGKKCFASDVWKAGSIFCFEHPAVIHYRIQRIPIETVPKDEETFGSWLNDLFVEKEALLEEFYKRGSFPGPQKVLKVRTNFETLGRICIFWIALFSSIYCLHHIVTLSYSIAAS